MRKLIELYVTEQVPEHEKEKVGKAIERKFLNPAEKFSITCCGKVFEL